MEGVGTVIIIFLLVCILALILVQIFHPPEVKVQQIASEPVLEEEKESHPRDYRFLTKPLNERYKWWGADIDHPLVTSSGYYDSENGMYYHGTQYLYGTDVASSGSNVMTASNAPVNYNSLVHSGSTSSSANASGFMNFDIAAYSPF